MTKTYKILTVIFLITIFSCNKNLERKKTILTETQDDCKPYFQFDKIEHFYLNIDEEKIRKIENKKNRTEDFKQLELLIQYTPDKLSVTIFT